MSTSSKLTAKPLSGVGLGLRSDHFSLIETTYPDVAWFEVLADNALHVGSVAWQHVCKIAEHYPIAQHSVGMSLGGTDPLNWEYLRKLKNFSEQIHPSIISDHLCWTSHRGQYFHDLLPLPYTEEAIANVVSRIQVVQDFFKRQIAIENVSSYLTYKSSEMTEWEFISEIANRVDCHILLDVTNVYVSAQNHGFDCMSYLSHLPRDRIKQLHLAGFTQFKNYLLDTHGAPVCDDVWDLYRLVIRQFGPVPTLVEWDSDVPDFTKLQQEAKIANTILQEECEYEPA